MELILKRDVENLGFADDIVTVKNGYGRNYLIPQGYGVLATPSARKVHSEVLKQRSFKEKKQVENAQALANKLNDVEIRIPAKSGGGDKLFGSITNADVAEYLQKEGIVIEKKYISVPGNTIKRLGQYEATVRFHREVVATKAFEVVAQK